MLFYLPFLICCDSIPLSQANYTEAVHNLTGKPMFLKLWASWCHHCKDFAPTWEELTNLSEFSDKVFFADIECETNRNLCKQFEGQNYPRLYWYEPSNETVIRYMGERSIDHLSYFLKMQLSYPFILVNDSEIEAYSLSSNVSSVFSFKIPSSDESSIKTAHCVASNLRGSENRFLLSANSDKPSLIAFTGINRSERYEGPWEAESIEKFVQYRSVPFLSELNGFILRYFENRSLPTFIVMVRQNQTSPLSNLSLANTVAPIMPVTYVNCSNIGEWICRYTGLYAQSSPNEFVIMDWGRRLFWTNKRHLNEIQELAEWAKEVAAGKIKGEGPGKGLLGQILEPIYEQRAQGKSNPLVLYFIAPAALIVSISFFFFDCISSQRETKSKEKEE